VASMKRVSDVLVAFGFKCLEPNEAAFLGFVARLISAAEEGRQPPYTGAVLREMAAEYGRYYLELDQSMRRAMRRLIEAEPAELRRFGVHLKKRTVCGLGEALRDLALQGS